MIDLNFVVYAAKASVPRRVLSHALIALSFQYVPAGQCCAVSVGVVDADHPAPPVMQPSVAVLLARRTSLIHLPSAFVGQPSQPEVADRHHHTL
ncbi:hypothetical protein KCP78_18845 [Salmonella enterica subsp. enterica]|nr:hypothetical protein KCP78_18845 [Salmonella enterica subsp. enterica]